MLTDYIIKNEYEKDIEIYNEIKKRLYIEKEGEYISYDLNTKKEFKRFIKSLIIFEDYKKPNLRLTISSQLEFETKDKEIFRKIISFFPTEIILKIEENCNSIEELFISEIIDFFPSNIYGINIINNNENIIQNICKNKSLYSIKTLAINTEYAEENILFKDFIPSCRNLQILNIAFLPQNFGNFLKNIKQLKQLEFGCNINSLNNFGKIIEFDYTTLEKLEICLYLDEFDEFEKNKKIKADFSFY